MHPYFTEISRKYTVVSYPTTRLAQKVACRDLAPLGGRGLHARGAVRQAGVGLHEEPPAALEAQGEHVHEAAAAREGAGPARRCVGFV